MVTATSVRAGWVPDTRKRVEVFAVEQAQHRIRLPIRHEATAIFFFRLDIHTRTRTISPSERCLKKPWNLGRDRLAAGRGATARRQ